MSVVAIKDLSMLQDYVEAWEDLAANAIEVNPFYESWMLVPALRELGTGKDLRVVLVLGEGRAETVLCGVFPLERKKRFKAFPVTTLSLWRHIYCGLCTPLIREGYARECLEAFLDWLASESDCSLMEFNLISGDGVFHQLLNDCLYERGVSSVISDSYSRALFRPAENGDKYLEAAISPKHRREFVRRHRRLSERGRIEVDELELDGSVGEWIEEFLRLEESSWKGKQGGAIACVGASRNYFRTVIRESFSRGRLMMSALRLNGKPLAQRSAFTSGRGAFAWKIAYDEDYAYFSPGILLEMESIRRLHARADIEWVDSCAEPIHFINRLWFDRKAIKSVLISTGRKTGDLVISMIPSVRRLNRRLRGIRQSPSPKQGE
jgi:hypothetical protein